MTGMTPVSQYDPGIRDEDFAAKLVRVPKGAPSGAGTSGPSFREVLGKAVHDGESAQSPAKAKQAKQDKRLWDACIEMESLLVGKMLKEMRKTVEKTGLINGGFAEEIFEDMLYDEYAMSLSKNSNLGMGKMLYDELKRKG
jgi:Rod binding domain-containing protein